MGRSPRHPIWIGGPRAAVLLLTAAFAVTCVLAWNAWRWTLSHQEVADQTVEEYAQVALWEFNRVTRWDLATAAVRRSTAGLMRLGAHDLEAPPPPPDPLPSLLHDAERPLLASGVQQYFRLDLAGGGLQVAVPEGASENLPADLEDQLRRHWEAGHTQDWQVGVVPLEAGYEPVLALYEVLSEPSGEPRVLLGILAAEADLDPIFQRVVAQVPLLPPSLLQGRENQDLLAVEVAVDGRRIWASGPPVSGGVQVREVFAPYFPGATTTLTLRPEASATLVPEAGGRMGTAAVIALLLTAGALLAVALLLLRREHELVRLRSDLVSGVSHELRTPLAQIRMFADTLYLGRARTEDEMQRSLRIISQESRRLAHLVDNVLLFAKVREGLVGEPRTEPLRLIPFIQDVLDQFEPLAAHRKARLRLLPDEPGDDLETLVVTADPPLFRQLLLNLLDNAVKYGPDGQVVQVQVTHPHPDHILLRVRDEGPGIPVRDQRSIWEAFSRLPRDREGPVAGAGIGLSVVSSVAHAHGWRLEIEDPEVKPGGGSFVVTIPVARSPHAGPQTESVPEQAGRTLPEEGLRGNDTHLAGTSTPQEFP